MMNIEVRADGARITGYVNVTEKKSRPVITPRGKVIEEIEPRAFAEAISRAGNITVTVDHDKSHIYASTDDGTVTLKEDAIGLHADVLIKDKDLIELAKKGKIRGWSFGMYNVKDSMEERAGDLPIRHIKALDLDHLTLVVKKARSTPQLLWNCARARTSNWRPEPLWMSLRCPALLCTRRHLIILNSGAASRR